jgi:hypothetical protein
MEVYTISYWFSTFLPGSLGGDLYKVYDIARATDKKIRPVLAVVIERLTGVLALLAVTVIALLLYRTRVAGSRLGAAGDNQRRGAGDHRTTRHAAVFHAAVEVGQPSFRSPEMDEAGKNRPLCRCQPGIAAKTDACLSRRSCSAWSFRCWSCWRTT